MGTKVAELNLESGLPTVQSALQKMKNGLITYKGQGVKAVIVIHGYGSTGVGGRIKSAVTGALGENSLRGVVRTFAGGEAWFGRKRELLGLCKDLADHERRIAGNEGVTVVILR